MARDANELLEEALKLPSEARAALAGSLLQSLDEEVDEDSEQAWSEELQCRMTEIDSGAFKAISWRDARKQILSGR